MTAEWGSQATESLYLDPQVGDREHTKPAPWSCTLQQSHLFCLPKQHPKYSNARDLYVTSHLNGHTRFVPKLTPTLYPH